MKMNTGSQFLTAKSVKKGQRIKIKDEGRWKENTRYTYEDGTPKKECIFTVESEGEQYSLRMNSPSRINMIEAFGDESKDWIGKEATIMVMPTPSGGNKMIVLDPVTDGTSSANSEIKPEDIQWED